MRSFIVLAALLPSLALAADSLPPPNPVSDYCTQTICNCAPNTLPKPPPHSDDNTVEDYCGGLAGNVGDCGPSGKGQCETCRFPSLPSFNVFMNCIIDNKYDGDKTWRQAGAQVGYCCYKIQDNTRYVRCEVACNGQACSFLPDAFGTCADNSPTPKQVAEKNDPSHQKSEKPSKSKGNPPSQK